MRQQDSKTVCFLESLSELLVAAEPQASKLFDIRHRLLGFVAVPTITQAGLQANLVFKICRLQRLSATKLLAVQASDGLRLYVHIKPIFRCHLDSKF